MRFIIRENTYVSICTFSINEPFETVRKFLEKHKHPDEKIDWERMKGTNGFAITMKLKNDSTGHLIWLREFEWTVRQIAILAHEITHLTTHIMDHKGIPIRVENDETMAYVHEFYFREAMWKLSKKFAKKKK